MATTSFHYSPAQNVTVKAQTDIEGGSFVEIADTLDGRNPVVKPATAGATVFGVVARDVKKNGYVMAYRAGHIVDVQATGSIAAGALVAAAKDGKATTAADSAQVAGVAVSAVVGGVVAVALK